MIYSQIVPLLPLLITLIQFSATNVYVNCSGNNKYISSF